MIYLVVSVLLGLCSWLIPFLKIKNELKAYKIILSFALCLLSIYVQILFIKSYGDRWTLIVDAVGALVNAVPVLIVGTIVANLLSLRKNSFGLIDIIKNHPALSQVIFFKKQFNRF